MAVKLITINLISKTTGEVKEVSFPMDSGLLKAASALPEEQRSLFLANEYYEFKRDEKRKRRILSLETMLEDCTEFEDGLVDDNPNPEELYRRNETYEFLYQAINTLTERQKMVIRELYYEHKNRKELAQELGLSENALAQLLKRILAKLRKFLEKKI